MAMPRDLLALDQARERARQLVRRRARMSAVTSLVPIPGAGMLADAAVFISLLEEVSACFGLSRPELQRLDPASRRYVLLAAGRVGADLIGRIATRRLLQLVRGRIAKRLGPNLAVRFVPLMGQGISAYLSYGIVVAMGDSHVDDCYRLICELHETGPAQVPAIAT